MVRCMKNGNVIVKGVGKSVTGLLTDKDFQRAGVVSKGGGTFPGAPSFGLLFFPYSFLKSEKNMACGAKLNLVLRADTSVRPYGGLISADYNLGDVRETVPYGGESGAEDN